MKKSKIPVLIASLIVGVLLVTAFMGCSGQSDTEADKETETRQYMSTLNQTADELSGKLDDFIAAVSTGDVVTMRTTADSAFKTLDTLSSLEAPEDLTEVQEDYVSGCDMLKDSLNDYVTLYTEISNSTDEYPFDYSKFDERLSKIQKMYDDGIDELKAADLKAAELEQ